MTIAIAPGAVTSVKQISSNDRVSAFPLPSAVEVLLSLWS